MKILKDTHNEYIFTDNLDIEDLNTRMVNRIDSIGDEMSYSSNVKADTTFGDLHIKYPEFREFADIVEKFAHRASIDMNMDEPNHAIRLDHPIWIDTYITSQICSSLWAIRYESEQLTTPHNHWPNIWAFTYYIDPPEGSAGLYFPNADYEIEVEHGLLVLFSGNIIHEVRPQKFEDYRYCIAGTIDTLKVDHKRE